MTVREVVLHRDIRAFADFSATTVLNRHHLRRFLSVFVLVGIDVAAIALAALLMVALTRTIRPAHPSPGVLILTGVCLVVVFVFLANSPYGRRFTRQSARRLARASLVALAVVAMAALVLGSSLDFRSIESWSIGADLSILARMASAVCGLRGAC